MPPAEAAYDASRLKVQLKLAIARMTNMLKRTQATGTTGHREIADLLKEQKEDRARLRVKHLIREDFLAEALEIINSYADDLLKSISYITACRECDPDLLRPLMSVVYSATRVEVPELLNVRDQLLAKFGRKTYEQNIESVDKKLIIKLSMKNPDAKLVEQYLEAIAASFGVDYVASVQPDEQPQEIQPPAAASSTKRPSVTIEETPKAKEASPKTTSTVANEPPPDYSSASQTGSTTPVPSPTSSEVDASVPNFDDLARRFAALKGLPTKKP